MDLVNRLKLFMQTNDIAISQFADNCKIPRPTMSQILNGRNKKISDELISKIHLAYPELSVLWLMFGEGSMILNQNIEISESLNSNSDFVTPNETAYETKFKDRITDSNNLANMESEDQLGNSYRTSETDFTDYFTSDLMDHHTQSPNDEKQSIIDFEPIGGNQERISYTNSETQSSPASGTNPDHVAATSEPDCNTKSTKQTSEDNDTLEPSKINGQETSIPLPNQASSQNLSFQTPPGKKITNIVVFYSDNSFQSFYPL